MFHGCIRKIKSKVITTAFLIIVSLFISIFLAACGGNNSDSTAPVDPLENIDIDNNEENLGNTNNENPDIGQSTGQTFHIDPINGSIAGDGSVNAPWHKLQDIFDQNLVSAKRWSTPYSSDSVLETINDDAPISGGDTLVLYSGHHGDLEIIRLINDTPITIRAAEGESPQVNYVHIQSSSNWIIDGLSVSSSYSTEPINNTNLVFVESHGWRGPSSHIDLINNRIFSATDVASWSADDWIANGLSGIRMLADYSTVINNEIFNIRMGISVEADFVEVKDNTVTNFSGDGIRGLGNNGLYEYNKIANGFKVDENHDDAFQSFTTSEESIKNVILRGNQIYYNLDHPNPDLISDIQGIGCFDGFYENWVIENNLVVVNHWHGITLSGARNSAVVNNTVVDLNEADPGPPWIRISPHKNGTHGENNSVLNNLSRINVSDSGTTVDHNLNPNDNPTDHFASPEDNDFRLKAASTAINAGISSSATPLIDITGSARNDTLDIGAYEYYP